MNEDYNHFPLALGCLNRAVSGTSLLFSICWNHQLNLAVVHLGTGGGSSLILTSVKFFTPCLPLTTCRRLDNINNWEVTMFTLTGNWNTTDYLRVSFLFSERIKNTQTAVCSRTSSQCINIDTTVDFQDLIKNRPIFCLLHMRTTDASVSIIAVLLCSHRERQYTVI